MFTLVKLEKNKNNNNNSTVQIIIVIIFHSFEIFWMLLIKYEIKITGIIYTKN